MKSIAELERMAEQVRRDIVRMVYFAQSGHPGGSLGCTEFMVALYFSQLEHKAPSFEMNGKGEDLFFLSNGHISPVWYSVLARSGYFPLEELSTFRRIDSRLQGHPATEERLPGVRVASGSLGQGLSVAIGAALGKKLDGDDHLVYALTGDGEIQEGQIWEAAMSAAHYEVDKLIVTVDHNGQQIDGPNREVMSLGDLDAKWRAFGWDVHHMKGNDMRTVLDGLATVKAATGRNKPVVILMNSEMGWGVDFMTGTHKWHGIAPDDEQFERAMAQLEETLGDYPYNPEYMDESMKEHV